MASNSDGSPWSGLPRSTKTPLSLEVFRQGNGSSLQLTLLVLRGASAGPTLLFFGALHGDEYEGPRALWSMYERLSPADLAGDVIFLPVANPLAYAAGRRTAPCDGKDLARTFPGSPYGSPTEQVAHVLHHQVIRYADFFCDLHSAGLYYRISPWVGYGLVEDPQLLNQQRQAAKVCGYPDVWGTALLPGRSLSSAADWNVPAIYVEAPGEGRAQEEDVERNCFTVRQLLSLYGVSKEPLADFEPSSTIEDAADNSGYLQIQTVAKHGGYFDAAVRLGDRVNRGDLFGRILAPSGEVLQEILAPTTGKLVFLRTFPVVQPGDSLGAIRDQS